MVNGIQGTDARGLNKGRGSKLCLGCRVRHETPEEARRTYWPKRCEYKDENNSLKNLNDKNEPICSSFWLRLNSRADFFSLGNTTSLREGKSEL